MPFVSVALNQERSIRIHGRLIAILHQFQWLLGAELIRYWERRHTVNSLTSARRWNYASQTAECAVFWNRCLGQQKALYQAQNEILQRRKWFIHEAMPGHWQYFEFPFLCSPQNLESLTAHCSPQAVVWHCDVKCVRELCVFLSAPVCWCIVLAFSYFVNRIFSLFL